MALVKPKTFRPVESLAAEEERDCNELFVSLEDVDAVVRRRAARDAVSQPDSATALVSRLGREQDAAVREVILGTLVRLKSPSAIGGLVDCLRGEDVALRNEAIEAFRQMGSEIDPVLKSLLADPDPDVRIFVVNILDSQRHPDVESWLNKVIEQDSHVNVCATAVDILCEVATEAAVEPLLLLKARFGGEPYIQFAADLALKRIRGV